MFATTMAAVELRCKFTPQFLVYDCIYWGNTGKMLCLTELLIDGEERVCYTVSYTR